jgi:di/tricarboxylate transporter
MRSLREVREARVFDQRATRQVVVLVVVVCLLAGVGAGFSAATESSLGYAASIVGGIVAGIAITLVVRSKQPRRHDN